MPLSDRDDGLRQVLATLAPGTGLREGLERILRGNTGALIVLGYDKVVESICTGGFPLDVEFSATRLRELAKMDGAVVLSTDGTRILRAATHLMPDSGIPTEESGTRHRTAQRVSTQTGYPVISVSQSMRIIGLYLDGRRHVLDGSSELLSRANQAIDTLERYKTRLDEVSNTLSALEIEDLVTVRDAVSVSQRLEMVLRIEDELEPLRRRARHRRTAAVAAAGRADGRRARRPQLIAARLRADRPPRPDRRGGRGGPGRAVGQRSARSDPGRQRAGLSGGTGEPGDGRLSPRGYRLLSRAPRLPGAVLDRVVEHFGSLQKVLAATADDLRDVEGIGETRARTVREALSRLVDASIVERYN